MDVPAVQQNSKMEGSSSPKQFKLEQKHDFVPNGRCTTPVEQKHETAKDVQKASLEARVEESVSISVKQLRLPQDLKNAYCEQLSQDATLCILEPMELQAGSVTKKISKPKQTMSDQNNEFESKTVNEPLQENQAIATENVEDGPTVDRKSECEHISVEQKGTFPEEKIINSCLEPFRLPEDELNRKCGHDQLEPTSGDATDCNLVQLGPQPADVSKNHGLEQLGPAEENAAKTPSHLGHTERRSRGRPRKAANSLTSSVGSTRLSPKKRKDSLISSVGSTRLLRSRSQEKSKAPDWSNNLAEVGVDREKKRKKKKKQMEKTPVNEFSRIRTHLRYLLHRIKYEQSFIDAYSGEGWKGQSLEKIKPEKELQRAKSEIFRRKLKIRDLFQRLDLSCAEGRLPETLFDSKGEIDSEDIFCAKCGSKDVAINNDIILCDGACERGFHQFCLEPPLLKEYIPPDDEGWLCPGCDCKVDCIELLNDSQGTKISVSESWEKVFPEEAAAAAVAGNKLGDNFGLPSDDSEDDDYDPDGPELDEKVQGDESSSDESDYYSASDDVGALPNNEQTLGLPSDDDSKDDDYDPSGLDPDQELKKESSSSDFTSDSEDFSVAFDENEPSGEVQGPITSTLNHIKINEERCGQSETKRHSLSDELFSLLDSDPGQGDSGSLYPKRHVERLDYKKLHDEQRDTSSDSSDEEYEEYGNTSSDSSDEDYVDTALPKRRRNNSGKATLVSPNGETPTVKHGKDASELEHNQKEGEGTHKRRTSKKFNVEGTDSPPARSRKDSSAPGSSVRSTTRSTYAEDVTQRLFKSFKENQYPERAVKENLARELALTVQQVSKWFENARWSSRHLSHMASSVAETASNKATPGQKNKKLDGPEPKLLTVDATCNGIEKNEQAKASPGVIECCSRDVKLNMDTEEDNGQNSSISKSKKRKAKFDSQATVPNTRAEKTPKQIAEINSPKTGERRKSSRIQSKNLRPVS